MASSYNFRYQYVSSVHVGFCKIAYMVHTYVAFPLHVQTCVVIGYPAEKNTDYIDHTDVTYLHCGLLHV